ncbi:MAG: phosphotransferase [Chloroflexia bacterium]
MNPRRRHEGEVEAFLRERLGIAGWTFALPRGSGHETYLARGGDQALFIKVSAHIERTIAMARVGLTPPVLQTGRLADGSAIVVQPFIEGHHPTRSEYRARLEEIARIIRDMHCNPEVRATLPPALSGDYASAGKRTLDQVRARWERVRAKVPNVAGFVDAALDDLERRIAHFSGGGLVASHNDICRDNWLFTADGHIYLVDLEAMALDDPVLDVGATLWWYYAPELWPRFLQYVGYPDDEEFRDRMWVRLALHCLNITLPRPGSFDTFTAASYGERLVDFRAAMERKGNPEL